MGIRANKRQTEIYDYIVGYIQENGYAPTLREIRAVFGIKSTATVHYHLKQMHDKGMLNIRDGESRAIQVVGYKFVKCN